MVTTSQMQNIVSRARQSASVAFHLMGELRQLKEMTDMIAPDELAAYFGSGENEGISGQDLQECLQAFDAVLSFPLELRQAIFKLMI